MSGSPDSGSTGDPASPEDEDPGQADAHAMPLVDHLIELRSRLVRSLIFLIITFAVAFSFGAELIQLVIQPLSGVLLSLEDGQTRRLIFTDLTESFFTQIKVAFFVAFFVSFPLFATQLWYFVAPGLYRNERKVFRPFLVATPVMFLLGASLAYFVVMPLAIRFLVGFEMAGGEGTLPLELEARIQQYVSLTILFVLAFGICFEMPVLIVLLARAGIITAEDLVARRRYAIVGVFVVAAIATPPDPVSQLALAVPLVLLYEVSVWMARRAERAWARSVDGS